MIPTGLKKKKKVSRVVNVLKEDRQAFELLLSEEANLEEAF